MGTMKLTTRNLLLFVVIILPDEVLGEALDKFLETYKDPIQNYIMTGTVNVRHNCDILAFDAYSNESTPQHVMELEKIRKLNTKLAFSHSPCVLVVYHVTSNDSLSALLEFGWSAIQHMRLALITKMGPDITLDMAVNTTKLPFLVSAQLDSGKEQFLCPVIGENRPRLEQYMCKSSYASYKDKILRTGIVGVDPYFVATKNGIDGMDLRMLMLLANKLIFRPNIIVPNSFKAAINMVCNRICVIIEIVF